MWLEAILSKDDLRHALAALTPTTIVFGEGGELHLDAPTDVTLVAGKGLRVSCRAHLRWAVLGLHVPVTLESATVLLEPVVHEGLGARDALHFRVTLETLDMSLLPGILEHAAIARVNAELARREAELKWTFSETLAQRFELPTLLKPPRVVDVEAAWGKVRVTDEALAFVVSVHASTAPAPLRAIIPVGHTARATLSRHAGVSFRLAASFVGLTLAGLAVGAWMGVARRRRSLFELILT